MNIAENGAELQAMIDNYFQTIAEMNQKKGYNMKIWHKPNEKPELNEYVIVRKHGFAQWKLFKFDNKTVFFEPATNDLWAYLKDIVEFATNAEQME